MYILLVLAALLLTVCFVLNKIYQNRLGTSLKAGFLYNCLIGFAASLIFFVFTGFRFEITRFSLLLSVLMTVLVVAYTLIGFRILSGGGVAVYTIFLMSGGMTVPYLVGIIFLNEEFKIIRTVGLIILIFAVALSNFRGREKGINIKRLLMCISVFILNGCVSVVSKLHQIETVHDTVPSENFVMLSGIAKFLIAGAFFLIISFFEKHKNKYTPSVRECDNAQEVVLNSGSASFGRILIKLLPLIALAALADGASYYLQLIGAANLPATVLYPAVTGTSMIFSVLLDMIVFRQKPSKYVTLSACLCFLGTLMFL